MTKTQLLAALSTKFYKVFTPSLEQTYGNLKWYVVKVYDKVGDTLRDTNIAFFVEDEGLAREAAYWSPSEPKPAAAATFQANLQTYITEKIADSTIKGAFTESIDTVNEKAVVKAVLDQEGTYVEKRLFIYKESGAFKHKQL